MNRLNPRTWTLTTKIAIALVAVSLIPLVIFSAALIANIQNYVLESRQTYITQTALIQQQGIQSTFRLSEDLLDLFLGNAENYATIAQALATYEADASGDAVRETSQAAQQAIRTGLLTEESYFDGVYLVSRVGSVTALTIDVNRPAPVQQENIVATEIYAAGRDLLNSMGLEREFIISQRGERTFFEFIQTINTEDGNIIGYIVATLNLETLVLDNFTDDILLPNLYSFLILPTNDAFISKPETTEANLVSFNSVGVQRAIGREASIPFTYLTSTADGESREVLGYSVPIQMLNKQFSLVLEFPTPGFAQDVLAVTQNSIFIAFLAFLIIIPLVVFIVNNDLDTPLRSFIHSIIQISRNDYSESVADYEERNDILGELANAIEITRLKTQDFTNEINARLNERTRDLRITQDIKRAITNERERQRMMDRVVNLVVENFPSIYHAQIFLSDGERYAVLRASTGDAGRALLDRGHKLEIGSVSVIGQVFEQGQTIIARDTASSDVHRRNEFLQATRAELAIPLQSEGAVIGALDVQSREDNAFTPDQVAVLETLSADIALALDNIRLFEESSQRIRQVEVERRNRTRLDWDTYLRPDKGAIYQSHAGNISSTPITDLQRAVYQNNQPIVGEETSYGTIPFAVPIRLRNQILGVATYELTREEFRYDKVLLAEELVSRLAISLDNARLFRESQLSAERERVVNEISAQLQGETTINSILETAIREVSRALRTPHVGIELQIDAPEPTANHGNVPTNGNTANGGASPYQSQNLPDKDGSLSDEDVT